MENGVVLMQRNNENEESVESSDAQEDIWDDTLLIKAYDRAVSLAKAKKDKISTTAQNNNKGANATSSQSAKDSQVGKSSKKLKGSKSGQNIQGWKVGSNCRAVYSEDGVEYEAVIIKMMDWKGKCIVHYIGYNNEEEVEIDRLKSSKGETARQQQMAEAACQMELEENIESQQQQQKQHQQQVPDGYRAKIPSFQASTGILPPPPPPHIMNNLPKTETEALSAMLMSWYMSGYHTGYYFGLANSNSSRQMSDMQKTDSGRHFKKK